MRNGFSVIICCYNSVARLPQTLSYIARQELNEDIEWELIVVDNNSDDGTAKFAEQEWIKYDSSIKLILISEPRPGLSFARKAGIAAASFSLLLFCDDDNWLAPDYLETAYRFMQQHPRVGVLGGYSEPAFESPSPAWFTHYQHAYALGRQLPESGIANRRRYIAGAGMVIRKSILDVLEQSGFHNILPDRKGEALSSGGDSELCLVILFLGYDLYYDASLRFIHFIPAKRLSWYYCVTMISEAHGIPQVYFSFYKQLYAGLTAGDCPDFDTVYKTTRMNIIKSGWRLINNMRNAAATIRAIAGSRPGSMREIQLKAFRKNLHFIITGKQRLQPEFERMKSLMIRILSENKRIHGAHRECFKIN